MNLCVCVCVHTSVCVCTYECVCVCVCVHAWVSVDKWLPNKYKCNENIHQVIANTTRVLKVCNPWHFNSVNTQVLINNF